MYPAHVFSLFPPFPRDQRVFVAMSFDPLLNRRWSEVIAPGVRACEGVEPYRVNASTIGDSILTEILTGISNSRLVLADISALGGVRNANVMYEVGLAHAVRQPAEVLLFRSDDERLLFDVANVRVNRYDPDSQPDKARELVTGAINEALQEIDLQKSLTVKRLANGIDAVGLEFLVGAGEPGGREYPDVKTVGQAIATSAEVQTIPRLIEQGLVEPRYATPEGEPPPLAPVRDYARSRVRYHLTPLGHAVYVEVLERLLGASK